MIVILTAVVVAVPLRGAPQTSDEVLKSLERDVQALKEGQVRMQRELQEIKTLLQRPPQAAAPTEPENLVFTLADFPSIGDAKAKLVLVDFTDYQ
jgi:hypothetical protein